MACGAGMAVVLPLKLNRETDVVFDPKAANHKADVF